jgi:hypothetical protein
LFCIRLSAGGARKLMIQIGANREGYAGGHCLSTRRVNAMR